MFTQCALDEPNLSWHAEGQKHSKYTEDKYVWRTSDLYSIQLSGLRQGTDKYKSNHDALALPNCTQTCNLFNSLWINLIPSEAIWPQAVLQKQICTHPICLLILSKRVYISARWPRVGFNRSAQFAEIGRVHGDLLPAGNLWPELVEEVWWSLSRVSILCTLSSAVSLSWYAMFRFAFRIDIGHGQLPHHEGSVLSNTGRQHYCSLKLISNRSMCF